MHPIQPEILNWLLDGDVSIQYQVKRDLLYRDDSRLRKRISVEGWGKQILAEQNSDGHWGDRFYQPKWISTHYTLLDLRNLCIDPGNKRTRYSIRKVLKENIADDGGIRLGPSTSVHSDVCVNGMFLNYASYFKTEETGLRSVVDSILNERMPDGGFNCRTVRTGAHHSSLHTTISVLEGLFEFVKTGYNYRQKDVRNARKHAEEFVLAHRLFLSDRTGNIISRDFLKLTYPARWKYDILRALDYFQYSASRWDERMAPAVEVLLKKRNKNGTWNMPAPHPGQVHLTMEKSGIPGRWNTLRAMRVLQHFGI